MHSIGVVGAGIMGAGITEVALRADCDVLVAEADERAKERAAAHIAAAFGLPSERDPAHAMQSRPGGRLSWTSDLEELARCDLVIEAITEDLNAKRRVLGKLDRLLPGDRLLATNTSSIPITRLGDGLRRPERFLGLHFFNPVPRMPLVEVIPSLTTADHVVAAAEAFVANVLRKITIRAKDRSGFVVNFLLIPYILSAIRAVQDGVATCEDIDLGMKHGCGMPMGPLRLADLIGLDTLLQIAELLHVEHANNSFAPPPLLRRYAEAGWLGRKSGRGFYKYDATGVVNG